MYFDHTTAAVAFQQRKHSLVRNLCSLKVVERPSFQLEMCLLGRIACTGSLAPSDFIDAVFTCAYFQKMPKDYVVFTP